MASYLSFISGIITSSITSVIYAVPNILVVQPLKLLYFQGPAVLGWGGWGGLPIEDICAQFTQVSADLWKNQREHCLALVDRKFTAVLVAVGCTAYFFTLYKLITYIWFRYFFLRPFLKELKLAIHDGCTSHCHATSNKDILLQEPQKIK